MKFGVLWIQIVRNTASSGGRRTHAFLHFACTRVPLSVRTLVALGLRCANSSASEILRESTLLLPPILALRQRRLHFLLRDEPPDDVPFAALADCCWRARNPLFPPYPLR